MNPMVNSKYWMAFVDTVANASTCRKKLGAVLVMDKHIIGIGYTGSVSGDQHCIGDNCLLVPNNNSYGSGDKGSCIRTMHAEMNAVLNIQYPLYTKNRNDRYIICYSTYQPCLSCFKVLLQLGVKEFVYKNSYIDLNRDKYINNLSNNVLKSFNMIHFWED